MSSLLFAGIPEIRLNAKSVPRSTKEGSSPAGGSMTSGIHLFSVTKGRSYIFIGFLYQNVKIGTLLSACKEKSRAKSCEIPLNVLKYPSPATIERSPEPLPPAG